MKTWYEQRREALSLYDEEFHHWINREDTAYDLVPDYVLWAMTSDIHGFEFEYKSGIWEWKSKQES